MSGSRIAWTGLIDGDYEVFTATYQAVPEPSTFALLALGALSHLRRRRRAS